MSRLTLALLLACSLWGGIDEPNKFNRNWNYTLYVDSVNGSDANSGASYGLPLKTIAALLAKSPGVASRIGLAANSVWEENLTLPTIAGCPASVPCVTASMYGPGSLPLFDASSAIAAVAWSKSGGYTNIYQATVTAENPAGIGFLCIWENNVCGPGFPYVSSLAALDAAANGYYVASQFTLTGTSFTVYVNATGHGNPASNGNAYRYTARLYGFNAGPQLAAAFGIHTRRNLGNNGSFSASGIITDVIAEDGSKHNVFTAKNSVLTNVQAKNSYYAGQSKNPFIVNDNVAGSSDTVTMWNVGCSEATEQTANCFFSHTNTSGSYGVIACNFCYTTGSAPGSFQSVTQANWIGGTFVQGSAPGTALTLYSNALISGITLTGLQTADIAPGANNLTITVDHSNITGANGGGGTEMIFITSTGTNLTLTNNTCTSAKDFLRATVAATITASGNTFNSTSATAYRLTTTTGYTADYDIFNSTTPTSPVRFQNGASTYNVGSWQTLTSQELHAVLNP